MNKIVWFRNDLRVSNNDAFNEAAKSGKILPIYIFDKEYHKLPTSSSFHLDFLKSSLEDLKKTLSEKYNACLLYTSPSPRDPKTSRMPSSA